MGGAEITNFATRVFAIASHQALAEKPLRVSNQRTSMGNVHILRDLFCTGPAAVPSSARHVRALLAASLTRFRCCGTWHGEQSR
jgi:hypothetical protein